MKDNAADEVSLIKLFIKEMSQEDGKRVYRMGIKRNKLLVADPIMDQVRQLSAAIINALPEVIKYMLFKNKEDIIVFKVLLKGNTFNGCVTGIKGICDELQTNIQSIQRQLMDHLEQLGKAAVENKKLRS